MTPQSPLYPCQHPRTAANSYRTGAGKSFCKQCSTDRRRRTRRATALARCEALGHARVEYANARGSHCCVTCEVLAGRRSQTQHGGDQNTPHP